MDIEKIITDFKSGKRIEGEGLLLEYKDFSKSNLTPGDLGNKIIMLISSLHNQPTNIQKAAYLIIGYDETLGKPVHNKKNIVSVEDIQKKIYDSLSKTVGISDITQSFTEKEGITVIRVNTRDNNILAEIKKGKYNGKTFIRVNSENMPNSEW